MPISDPLSHIRAHPEMYLTGARIDPSELATRLAGDALTLGASRTLVVHRDAWWAVAADLDWLAAPPFGVAELFQRVIPFPQAGSNSMRSEVLLGAFADDVLTWNTTVLDAVKGQPSPDVESLRQMIGDPLWLRVIAFRVEPAPLKKNPAVAVIAG